MLELQDFHEKDLECNQESINDHIVVICYYSYIQGYNHIKTIICYHSLNNCSFCKLSEPLPLEDTLEPNRTFYLNLGFHTMDPTTIKPMTQINSVSFREPSMPLLRNHSSINLSQFCYYKDVTQEMIDKCSSEYCSCIHVIKTNINEVSKRK